MAQIKLTKNWEALSVTTGTIQNLSAAYNVEISEDNTDGTGQVLMPGEAFSFTNLCMERVVHGKGDKGAAGAGLRLG